MAAGSVADIARHYTCYSDEHYIPTLLAYHGLANRTDCLGYTTHVSWSWDGPHPVSYSPENVTAELFRGMRMPAHCDSAAALKCAPRCPAPRCHLRSLS